VPIWPRTKEDVNDLFERIEKLEKDAEKAKVQRDDTAQKVVDHNGQLIQQNNKQNKATERI
jgi:hypothetical protein